MHPETLYPKTAEVLASLEHEAFLKDFYLAGGTALALQLGHRKSIDLDFFTQVFPKQELLLQNLEKFKPTIVNQSEGTIDVLISGIKVSFLSYTYPLIAETVPYQEIQLADVRDIACMKLTAISSRGSKKDFVDLAEILQKHSLQDIFSEFERKYTDVAYEKLHILKSLVFFDDAEKEPDPDYIRAIQWDEVKAKMIKSVKVYIDNGINSS